MFVSACSRRILACASFAAWKPAAQSMMMQSFFAPGKRLEVRSQSRFPRSALTAIFVAAIALPIFSATAAAQAAPQQAGQQQATTSTQSPAGPAPKHDLTGVWQLQGDGGATPLAPDEAMPPMTPWAKARFDAQKPGYGPR